MGFLGDFGTQSTDFLGLTDSEGAKDAANQAAARKKAAYESLQGLDTGLQDTAALKQAAKNYKDQLDFAKSNSPGAYEAYMAGDKAAAAGFFGAANNVNSAQRMAEQSALENTIQQKGSADSERLANDQSAELLRQGGSLSPEMQAELMRSGFATGAGVGGTAGSDAMRSGMARQLASDQLNIQAQRGQMAGNLQNQAANIRASRNAMLNSGAMMQGVPSALGAQIAQQSGDVLASRIPQGYGVGGDVAASNYVSNTNLENQKKLGAAGVDVENINAQYQASRAGPRAAATVVGGVLGGMFGGMGGASMGANMGAGATAN